MHVIPLSIAAFRSKEFPTYGLHIKIRPIYEIALRSQGHLPLLFSEIQGIQGVENTSDNIRQSSWHRIFLSIHF